MHAFRTFYADRNIGSRRYRDRLVNTNACNMVRLLDNVRFSLTKGDCVCGLTGATGQPDSQTSEDQPQQDHPVRALRRKRPAGRKRSIMRFAKRARMAGIGARVCLSSNSLLDCWSDLEASQPTVVPDCGHGVAEDPTTVRQSHIGRLI